MTTSFTDKKAVTTVSPEARDAWFKWQLTPPVPTSWELPEEAREDFEDAIMLLLLTGEDDDDLAGGYEYNFQLPTARNQCSVTHVRRVNGMMRKIWRIALI